MSDSVRFHFVQFCWLWSCSDGFDFTSVQVDLVEFGSFWLGLVKARWIRFIAIMFVEFGLAWYDYIWLVFA
jgi:hypothetical protein